MCEVTGLHNNPACPKGWPAAWPTGGQKRETTARRDHSKATVMVLWGALSERRKARGAPEHIAVARVAALAVAEMCASARDRAQCISGFGDDQQLAGKVMMST